ncbi:MAG: SwmB domain-containing protein, partial [Desulfurellaceae bacterium]|nr:SwmB domain-containing protein [Desulfurellaceae bacterium]
MKGILTAVVCVLLLGAGTAQAQSTLVGNTGQSPNATDLTVGRLTAGNFFEHATAFTTGATSGGYAISGVDVRLGSSVPADADPRVTIHDVTSGGDPNNLILTLTKPATLTANAVNTFTAAPGAKLGAHGTYAVVLRQAGSSGSWTIRRTSSNSEDSGGASGWSIDDGGRDNNSEGGSGWSSTTDSLMIAVKGWEDTTAPTVSSARVVGTKLTITFNEDLRAAASLANSAFTVKRTPPGGTATNVSLSATAPSVSGQTVVLTLARAVSIADTVTVSYAQPTSGTDNQIRDTAGNAAAGFTDQSAEHALASTIGQVTPTTHIENLNGKKLIQRFTTGAGSGGYKLTSIDLKFATAPNSTVQVQVHENDRDRDVHATLTNPSSLAAGDLTFTAPANTETLAANSTYAVVVSLATSGQLQATNSTAEDAGGAPGWSIANSYGVVDTGHVGFTGALSMRINGSAADTTAPAVVGAWVAGDKLTIVFDEVLGAATLANSDFAVKKTPLGGTETNVSLSTAPAISGRTVVLTLASDVASTDHGFKVSYTPTSGTANRIVNLVDIEAETFADQAVTNSRLLVSNTGQTTQGQVTVGVTGSNNFQQATAFTTGPSTGGYTVATVDVDLSFLAGDAPQASIYSTDSSGNPDVGLHTLTKLGTSTVGDITFAAPADATLDAGTTYAVVVEDTGSSNWLARVTGSDDEDAGGAHGWSIADRHVFQDAAGSGGWGIGTNAHSLLIAIRGSPVDTTGPTFASALVERDKVTITFNEALGAAASLANTDFEVKKTASDGTESTVTLHGTTGPAISGNTAVLTLTDGAVGNTDGSFKVSYRKPTTGTDNRIVNAADIEADSFSDQYAPRVLVSNIAQTSAGTLLTIQGAVAQEFTTGSNSDGYTLTGVGLLMHGQVAAGLRARVLAETATGTLVALLTTPTESVHRHRFPAPSGTTLAARTTYVVVLDSAAESPSVTSSNSEDTTGASDWGISDGVSQHDGTNWVDKTNALNIRVVGDAITLPTVSAVAITSTPSHDADNSGSPETYGLGDTIEVQVTFSKPVTVTGTPRLKIKMDPSFGEKWAEYDRGSGTKTLTFDYEVESPNTSPQGIAVLENTLELNSGTIKAGSTDANLAHTGLAHDAGHKVDHQLTETPPPPEPPPPPDPSGDGSGGGGGGGGSGGGGGNSGRRRHGHTPAPAT